MLFEMVPLLVLLCVSAHPSAFLCLPRCSVPVFHHVVGQPIFNFAPFDKLTGMNTLSAVGLGFLLALLIFIDQNIVISLTHVPEHK